MPSREIASQSRLPGRRFFSGSTEKNSNPYHEKPRRWLFFLPKFFGKKLSEEVGFEPTDPEGASCFQDRCNRPLCHSSKISDYHKHFQLFISRELFEKPNVILCKISNIPNVIQKHRKSLYPHTPCIPRINFRIDVPIAKNIGMDHSSSENL